MTPEMLTLVRTFKSPDWPKALQKFLKLRPPLAEQYAKARSLKLVPLVVAPGKVINLSPGEHSELIRRIVETFAPRFAPGGHLLYAGDTGAKWGYHDADALRELGVTVDSHGKMPDAIIHIPDRNWLLLCESVTSHGPVDAKRHDELKHLFSGCDAGLVFVTAFPSRAAMARHLDSIAWETEVWCADAPDHLIHLNGERFLGPYSG